MSSKWKKFETVPWLDETRQRTGSPNLDSLYGVTFIVCSALRIASSESSILPVFSNRLLSITPKLFSLPARSGCP
jgi:hypothetical protein